DKGVDVIVMPENNRSSGLLVQVKHSSNRKKIGSDAIKEVYSVKKYFEKIFNIQFDCSVATNTIFDRESIHLASINNVRLLQRNWFEENILHGNIFWSDVRKLSLQRLEKIC
ncbi:MAG: restriction endonuclease, partial [Acidobacteria bacterium]|nr:restriction endonuclease [Acidobacteriota bacterium]